ncbi:MAG: hypothetical protein KF762_03660 [Acidobacteria bacterium]|nr:hypothetical protein [Acidobacteriota bacterium]
MTKTHIYIAAGLLAAAVLAAAISSAVTSQRITRLERVADAAILKANDQARRAAELEKETYVYKEKITYLEARLGELDARADRQTAELERLSADTDSARRALRRHRGGASER